MYMFACTSDLNKFPPPPHLTDWISFLWRVVSRWAASWKKVRPVGVA